MKIIATSDWHLGNLFHGNDRLLEHKHFLEWLLTQVVEHEPDVLLVAGDVFDNGNPSAASQSAYYEFLADVTKACPDLHVVITAGNHDSASRLEAPRALLMRYNVEIRGTVHKVWRKDDGKGAWEIDYDDLMIPIEGKDGEEMVVLAVPYLRNDVVQGVSYSAGINKFLSELTKKARDKYSGARLVMMAHLYVRGAEIAGNDASEKIIGGQEEVNIEGWSNHPDYMTCGHIHKRQHVWDTDWARYTGSVLPMSFAEVDYKHGVDMITIGMNDKPKTEFIEYHPQHRLLILPKDEQELTKNKLLKLIDKELTDRDESGQLDENFVYVALKVNLDKISADEIKEIETYMARKNAVLCKIQRINSALNITTINTKEQLQSVDDILNRDPLDTLKEAFMIKHHTEMSESQQDMIRTLLESINDED